VGIGGSGLQRGRGVADLLKMGTWKGGGAKHKKKNKDCIKYLNGQDTIVMTGSWVRGDTYGTGECRRFVKIRKIV
jgi:hypothetical protein